MKLPEFWRTYAAVLALAGLGSYIWFVDRKKPDTPDGGKPKEKVFTLDKAKVGELTISPAEGEGRLVEAEVGEAPGVLRHHLVDLQRLE